MREAERVRTGVPLALEPLKRAKNTVELSPSSVPAAPKRVGELDVNIAPSLGEMIETVGPVQSLAALIVAFAAEWAVKAAEDMRTPEPAAARAASTPMTARRLTPCDPPRQRSARPRAIDRRAPTGR